MADRYFIESPIQGSTARLVSAEAHHLAHVMRAKAGDEVTLFDGSGAEFLARIERVGRADVELSIVSREMVDRELPVQLILGVTLPKGDRQRWLVEKATELGVARVTPIVTEHSTDRASRAALEKLRRAVIEASKQCGRNRLMEIAEPQPWAEFLAAATDGGLHLIAHPAGKPCGPVLDELMSSKRKLQSVILAIGPEGGFTPNEIDRAESLGWHCVDLGPRILRVETAALALTAQIVARINRTGDAGATGGE